jgi:hypothetical protein
VLHPRVVWLNTILERNALGFFVTCQVMDTLLTMAILGTCIAIRLPIGPDFALAYMVAKGLFKFPRLALNLAMAGFLARAFPALAAVRVSLLLDPLGSAQQLGARRPSQLARSGGAPLARMAACFSNAAITAQAEALRQADRYGLALLLSKNLNSPLSVLASFGLLQLGSSHALVQGLVRRGSDMLARAAGHGLPFAGATFGGFQMPSAGQLTAYLAVTRVLLNLLFPLVFLGAARYMERRRR